MNIESLQMSISVSSGLVSSTDKIWEESWDNITFPSIPTNPPQAIGHAVGEMAGQVLQSVFDEMTSIFTDSESKSNDKTDVAVGGVADQINSVTTERHNQELKRRSQPAPSSCASEAVSKEQLTQRNIKNEQQKKSAANMREQIFQANANRQRYLTERVLRAKEQAESFSGTGSSGDSTSDSVLAAATEKLGDIFEQNTIILTKMSDPTFVLNGASYINAITMVESLIGYSSINDAGPLLMHVDRDLPEYTTRTAYTVRVLSSSLTAQFMFNEVISRRLATTSGNQSFLSSIILEMERTYSDTSENSWREKIKKLTHSVPLLIEQNYLVAYQNYLLYLITQEQERIIALKSIQVIEMVRKQLIENKFKSLVTR